MPTWKWTEEDTVEIEFGNLADIRAYEPPEGCPMPESEKLANYLMRLLDTMNSGSYRLAKPILTDQVCTAKNSVQKIQWISDYLYSIEATLEIAGATLSAFKNGTTDNLFSLASNADKAIGDFSLMKITFDSLLEKFVLLQADISAVKIQIDKLYIEKINFEGEIAINKDVLEKAFLLPDKLTPILGRAFLQSDSGQGVDSSILKNGLCFIEPGEIPVSLGVAERVGILRTKDPVTGVEEKISRLACIEEELVGIEAADKVLEIGSNAIYLKSKVIRSD